MPRVDVEMGGAGASDSRIAVEPKSGLSHDAIREELDRILEHREFHATDKMKDFLRFVVEETLAGRGKRLKGYTIATRVFGRDDDFDATLDPIVSIQAGRLRRALERYYLVAGGRDPIRIDVPKGRYVPRFVGPASPPPGAGLNPSGSLDMEPDSIGGPSIAVLPFENLTDDPDQLVLAIGLTEDLVTEMSRFQDIVVIPCHHASRTARVPADPRELGQATGARFVLQGAVRRDTETAKVSAHLTDTKSGRQVWAGAYKRPLEASRMLATQEEIARSVVATIASEYGIVARRLSAESRRKAPAELDTYHSMLRYYAHQIAPSPESAAASLPALQRAVEREPEYGPAWSALATLHCQAYSMDVAGFEGPLDTALDFARRGASLDPGSQLSHLILSYASYLADDADSFHQQIETALELNPNSPYALGTAGYCHVLFGEFERGSRRLDRAIAMNPYHPDWFRTGYLIQHFRRLDYESALRELRQHNPVYGFWRPVAYGAALAHLGRLEEARVHVEELEEQKPDFAPRARELLRRTLKVEAILDDLIEGLCRAGLAIGSG